MELSVEIFESNYLDPSKVICVDNFLKKNHFACNTLFASPVWAKKISRTYDIEYSWVIFYKDEDIVAAHLHFDEYRGFIRFANYHAVLQAIIKPIVMKFFSYKSWKTPLLLDNNLDQQDSLYIEKYLEGILEKLPHVTFSPMNYIHSNKLRSLSNDWSTYIFDFSDKTYNGVFSAYSRSLKRSLKGIDNSFDIECFRLDFNNAEEVNNFIKWVSIEQSSTGKMFIYDLKTLVADKKLFLGSGYIYEIFIAINSNKSILGSLTVYGDSNYITEAEANASIESKNMKIFIHDFLRDKVVKFCFDENIQFYDLAGFNPKNARSDKEEGIKFAKSKFKANEIKYSELNW